MGVEKTFIREGREETRRKPKPVFLDFYFASFADKNDF